MHQGHLLPFLWLHGESTDDVLRGVREIADTGARMLCCESRTHPDFLGTGWWEEMQALLDACRRWGMRFYLLDDTHFPSGYANGAAAGTPLQRMMMTETHVDLRGPLQDGRLLAWSDGMKGFPVAAVAARKLRTGTRVESFVDLGGFAVRDGVDLTARIRDGLLKWDVPEGDWRVFYLTCDYVTERNPPQAFLNPLLPEAGKTMVDTVMRPHAEFFGPETGRTFLGFFSDEPALRAGRGSHALPGEFPHLPIPWRRDMPELLSRALGEDAVPLLPGCWYDIGEKTRRVRYALMDTVSSLYARNYSQPIGAWCRERGLEYIGHIIEQNNAHSRLGQGAGHFFRAQSGQTMAGMDMVLHELMPDFARGYHAWPTQDFEAEDDFFRHMLGQMTLSAAVLDPHKGGRALCEIFGAYGWQEDLGEMRYLAGFALSRGINYFTPHAFTLRPAPDPDSPPHFGSEHPLHGDLKTLFAFMERTASLIEGGRPAARTGVLYYAEAEWGCGSTVMTSQHVVRVLEEDQVSCLVVPIDSLEAAELDVLLIPEAPAWPRKLFPLLDTLRLRGTAVAFVNRRPGTFCDGEGTPAPGGDCIPLASCAAFAREHTACPVRAMQPVPDLHVYPYLRPDGPVCLLFNENSREPLRAVLEALDWEDAVLYDPLADACVLPEHAEGGLEVRLDPGQLLVLAGKRDEWPAPVRQSPPRLLQELSPLWHVSFPGQAMEGLATEQLPDLYTLDARFAGTAMYTCELRLPACGGFLFPGGHGTLELRLDGVPVGLRVAAPYLFRCQVPGGVHTLTVRCVTSPALRWRDPLSRFAYLPPAGLTGPVGLLRDDTEEV